MAWKKVPVENAERLEKAMSAIPEAENRKMFGCPAYFLNGNMFAGAHEDNIMLRLSEADGDELISGGGAPFTPVPGRVMKGYFVIPLTMLDSENDLAAWLRRSRDYVVALPPKEKKRSK